MIAKSSFEGFESIVLSNEDAELIVTTSVGPRVLSFRLSGSENILGLHLDAAQKNELGIWKPYGGHRLWAAPEEIPRTYYPDNDTVEYEIIGEHSVVLHAPVERITEIRKEMRISLVGSNVTIEHRIQNCGNQTVELAPWSLTILRSGGWIVIPQEPFRSHDEVLLPARPMVLWHFTDLTDPRYRIGSKLLELECNEKFPTPTKIGVLNKLGWAGYYSNGLLFIKEFDFKPDASYPDYGCNCEAYTQAGFVELESLGPMKWLRPGESTEHWERWKLTALDLSDSEEDRRTSIEKMIR